MRKHSKPPLTTEQQQHLQQILKQGTYKNTKDHNNSIHKEHLYQAFKTYCHYKGIGTRCFKVRYFRKIHYHDLIDRYGARGGLYHDIPLSIYQIRIAITQGIANGDIIQVNTQVKGKSHNRRIYRFIKTQEDGNQHDAGTPTPCILQLPKKKPEAVICG